MRDREHVPLPADPPSPRPVVRRTAARVVFVADDDTVLLISGRDPSLARAAEFWFTPGGGAEPGETLEETARREVHEETGYVVDSLGPVVWERVSSFAFDGASYSQAESFFVVRAPRFDAHRVAWTDIETRSMTGWRWWPVDELCTTDAVIYPPGLGELVADWLAHGPPARPRRIG